MWRTEMAQTVIFATYCVLKLRLIVECRRSIVQRFRSTFSTEAQACLRRRLTRLEISPRVTPTLSRGDRQPGALWPQQPHQIQNLTCVIRGVRQPTYQRLGNRVMLSSD